MSVTLSPIAPRCAVSGADDPYKKYWWAILASFAFTGFWLLTPMLGEKSIGSTRVETDRPKTGADIEQSFASLDAGGGIDLAMDGALKKQSAGRDAGGAEFYGEGMPLPGSAGERPDSTRRREAASTLADALKTVGRGEGGWGEKAQKGFNAPKLAGGSLSGMSAAGGGRAGSAGSSVFGLRNAEIGYAAVKSLAGGGAAGGPVSKGLAALRSAAASAEAAAGQRSGDGAVGSLSRAFDGAKDQNAIGGLGGAGLGGAYAALDAAPINLKLNDPKLDGKKLSEPPASDIAASDMKDSDMAKQLAMSMIAVVVGGVIGGAAGGVVTQIVQQQIQRQDDQDKQRLEALKNKHRG